MLAAPPLYVVADGMGGHQGGAVASQIVVDEFAGLALQGLVLDATAATVLEAMTRCQTRIRAWSETRGGARGWHAGTTVVVAVAVPSSHDRFEWLLASLGDSRIYQVHEGIVEQVTVDHSVVQQLVDAGRITADEALTHPERDVITKALGSPDLVQPDLFVLPGERVDRLLLCSDGINGMISPAELTRILAGEAAATVVATDLVAAALAAGGRDNATAIVVDVMGLDPDHTDTVHARTGPDTLGDLP